MNTNNNNKNTSQDNCVNNNKNNYCGNNSMNCSNVKYITKLLLLQRQQQLK